MTLATSLVLVSTMVGESETFTVSLVPAICRRRSNCSDPPTSTRNDGMSPGDIPGKSVCSEYSPGGKSSNAKLPSLLLKAERTMPVALLASPTEHRPSRPPDASETKPRTAPVELSWDRAEIAKKTITTETQISRARARRISRPHEPNRIEDT